MKPEEYYDETYEGRVMKPSDLNYDKAVQLLRDYLYYQQQQKKRRKKNGL